jgi:ubiquinone/menaquinone biosynthesis C-methylase UbiE
MHDTSPAKLPIEPLFERAWWIYALCRERVFTDHTEAIADAFRPLLENGQQRHLIEVGCGPGFYARRLAARFPNLCVTGIDISERLLCRARARAQRAGLRNCSFLRADAKSLEQFPGTVDAVIASRLFLILADRAQALNAIFQTLRPGGICFVAEPTSVIRAALPLWLMRLAMPGRSAHARNCIPVRCEVLSEDRFQSFIGGEPWGKVRLWKDNRYQYALCEKPA